MPYIKTFHALKQILSTPYILRENQDLIYWPNVGCNIQAALPSPYLLPFNLYRDKSCSIHDDDMLFCSNIYMQWNNAKTVLLPSIRLDKLPWKGHNPSLAVKHNFRGFFSSSWHKAISYVCCLILFFHHLLFSSIYMYNLSNTNTIIHEHWHLDKPKTQNRILCEKLHILGVF